MILKIIKKLLKKEANNMKFNTIANEWLDFKKVTIKQSTYNNYLYIIEKYLNNELHL